MSDDNNKSIDDDAKKQKQKEKAEKKKAQISLDQELKKLNENGDANLELIDACVRKISNKEFDEKRFRGGMNKIFTVVVIAIVVSSLVGGVCYAWSQGWFEKFITRFDKQYTFKVEPESESENKDKESDEPIDYVKEYGLKWIPEGYELVHEQCDELKEYTNIAIFYENGSESIMVSIMVGEKDLESHIFPDMDSCEIYEYSGKEHYIAENNEMAHIVWYVNESIVLSVTTPEEYTKKIIQSYYKEVN